MSEVLFEQENGVGRIRLNRPQAIHALTAGMCGAMLHALQSWARDPDIKLILVDHAEGRGFCAGGDIRMLAQSAAADGAEARAFFRTEYQLNHLMFTYEKPIVAFMDGVTMGGGVGISQPARFRIATENCRFAMPETGIGLFTDVGGGWYLSRLPGRIGQYLALTGHRLNGAECVALDLATHYVAADRLAELKAAIQAEPDRFEALIEDFSSPLPFSPILVEKDQIDHLFQSDSLEDILAALAEDGGEWAAKQLAILESKSPLSMKVCLRLLKESRALRDFADEMRLEFAVAARIIESPDFVEGVRALIVDKDNSPVWRPATPALVTEQVVSGIFAPLGEDDAWNPVEELA
ncbi:MAG: enoyl-CoA hydratase/isomerase family protein [Novosphingobium sp.]|nr:enoyl-CoA hydratase/isomerase family protein [Novosphingobium sp.]